MLIITSTDVIRVTTTAITTNAMDCVTSYREITATTYTPARTVIVTNGVTAVNIVPAPSAGTQRVVDYISIFNRDTITSTVSISMYNGVSDFILWSGTLASGDRVEYQDGYGFQYKAQAVQGYAINVQSLAISPADGGTYYFGTTAKAAQSTVGSGKTYIRKGGTIKIVEIETYALTAAGGNEAGSVYLRLNNATDYLIQTVSVAAAERVFVNTGLSIPVSPGDFFEMKMVCPTWVTNPTGMSIGGYVYLE